MPSSAPLIRSMDWSIAKEYLPISISCHLPNGDPLHNQEEIHELIEKMMILGPRGIQVSEMYIRGEISEEGMDKYLDAIANDINEEEMESFRDNLRTLQDELRIKKWKILIPLFTQSVDTNKIRKISKELRNTCIYETKLTEEEKLKSVTEV